MFQDSIIQDYRDDWIKRAVLMKNIPYANFNHKNICWAAYSNYKNTELYQVMDDILRNIRDRYAPDMSIVRYVPDDTFPNTDILLIWKLTKTLSDFNVVDNTDNIDINSYGAIIYVYDDIQESIPLGDNIYGLYCGGIYGAGLTSLSVNEAKKTDSTNILDFFCAQIFMLAGVENIRGGIYYAGHGSSGYNNIEKPEGYEPAISYEDGSYMLDFFRRYPERRFYFDNTYGGKLHLLHDLLYKCLLEFDRICKEHDIRYFLGGGTLLGAARHEGMIPWDDDIDVMMLRPDYERFISVAAEAVSEGIFFQSSLTDPQYHSVFPKLRLDETRFVTEYSSQFKKMHQGIFIDIFVHDNTSGNKIGQKLHVFKTLFARSMVFHKWAGTPMQFYGKLKLICKIATNYIKKTPMDRLEEIQDKVIRKYEHKNTGFMFDGTGEHLRHGAFPAGWLEDTVYMQFNGKKFPVPAGWDQYLQYSYGDYKEWIPASLRKAGHDIVEVDFGIYDAESE